MTGQFFSQILGPTLYLMFFFVGIQAKSRFVIFGEMSSFGKVFKISIVLDVYFVKWNPPSFKSFDTDNMADTAVAKSLKGSN